jgi:hypothetical protein
VPLIPSVAYGQVGSVTSLVRSLLNDAAANVFTDAVLLPYLNDIYLTLQKKVANAGGGEFITDDVLLVVPLVAVPDPGTQVVLNDATLPPNQLPANLIVPLKLWERPNLSTQDFVEMVDLTEHGGLPSRWQGFTLGVWEWRTDGVYFIGATQDTQIRLRYEQSFPPLSGPTDVILLRGSSNAIAHGTAALAGMARGSPLAEQMENLFTDSVEDVIVENVRRQQNAGVRRKSYRSRRFSWGRGW